MAAAHTVTTGKGREMRFAVIRSRRRKTSEISVDPTGIVVRVPHEKKLSDIKLMVRRKADWIESKQDEYRQIASEVAKPTFEEGSRLPYLGRMVPLRVNHAGGRTAGSSITYAKGEFRARLYKDAVGKEAIIIKDLYEQWLETQARKHLAKTVKTYSKSVGAKPRQIAIKNLKQRWGSATKENVLNLNVNLLKAPEEVIDYVVLHELCHLKIRDHSHRFWNLLGALMPDYKEREEWLEANALGIVE